MTDGFNPNIQFAEDRDLVGRLTGKRASFNFYTEIAYGMSLRRIERQGIIKYLITYIIVNLKKQIGFKIDRIRDYPMGGDY